MTLLEEDKIMAYFAGGTLYASDARMGWAERVRRILN